MKVVLWGTRGSLPAAGHSTARYGGNTSSVQVIADDGTMLALDAGSGIRPLGGKMLSGKRVDLLLTHLHMDHVQGLGFFAPMYVPGLEVHIWGPSSTTHGLADRLRRYLSPPLFPVRLRDLPCKLHIHELLRDPVQIGPFNIRTDVVCHPGATLGYRIEADGKVLTYLPDHEPALGVGGSMLKRGWTSGHLLAQGSDLLIHDAQYDDLEYPSRIGWGHSTIRHALEFATLCDARRLVTFHHDPSHDDRLDTMMAHLNSLGPKMPVIGGSEGHEYDLNTLP